MCFDCCIKKPAPTPTKHVSISHKPSASMAVQRSQISHQIPSVASVALSQQIAQAPGSGERMYLSSSHRALLEQAKASASKSTSPHPTVSAPLHIDVKATRDPHSQEKQADFDRKVNGVAQDLIV